MSTEGLGMTVNFGDLSMNLNEDINLIDIPTPEGLGEGQTITAMVQFEPFPAPAIPNLAPFVIIYFENRKRKRKKRPNGTMIKHNKRKVDKCKVKIEFNGVVESAEDGNVIIRKVRK